MHFSILRKHYLLIPLAGLALAVPLSGDPQNRPAWWTDEGTRVIPPGAIENNRGPANIGQAKHMVAQALKALDTTGPTLATQIRADLAGTAPNFTNRILDLAAPANPAEQEKQKAPLLLGQLKAIAAPFYSRLAASSPANAAWLAAERTTNDTNYPNSIFPWTAETTDDQNKSIATIGQLKAVFSLRFTQDTDTDGLPDLWEIANFANLNQGANGDTDGDYISNLVEFQNGSNPNSATDGNSNGIPDDWELANTGKFSVYPPAITAELPRMQTASKPLYLWNDTDSVVNYSATVTGASVPAYSHKDSLTGGIAPSWEDGISTTGTHLATISGADEGEQSVDFTNSTFPTSFTFPFYGRSFNQISVSSNGLLCFGAPSTSYDNRALPDPTAPFDIIAPFWDDLNPRAAGDIFFEFREGPDRFIVEFNDVAKYDGSGNLTFQVILFADGRIRFNYQTLTGRTDQCTVGLQSPGGFEGLTVTQNSSYLHDGMTVEISPVSDFLEISPPAGAVPARSVLPLAGLFRSVSLAPGIHPAAVEITHDSTASASPLEINASLQVVDLPGTIALTAPLDGGSVLQGASLDLAADAEDLDGIANVAFFRGETLIEVDTTAPYGVSTSTLPPGNHDITARLTDRSGQITISAPRSLTVSADTDFDGMPDAWETANYLDPNNNSDAATDADGDGYTNLEEYEFGKNPKFAEDTDGDLMPDGWEYYNGLDPNSDDAAQDLDEDGLTNLVEYQTGTLANYADSDSDGFHDALELEYEFLDPTVWNDPNGDHDLDGIRDLFEAIYGLDLEVNDASLDPDGDGLTNFEEFQFGSPPNNPDIDHDGLDDSQERSEATDPWKWDSDGDQLPDGWEVKYALNPTEWQSADLDREPDGLKDIDEVRFGTDPFKDDSDGDGVDDGDEVANNTDPMDDEWGGIPPAAPSNVVETQNTDGTTSFTWQDNSNNEKSFRIYRHLPDGNKQLLGEVQADTTSFIYTPPSNP